MPPRTAFAAPIGKRYRTARWLGCAMLAAGTLLVSANLAADIIHLKNGHEIEGQVIQMDDRTLTIAQ